MKVKTLGLISLLTLLSTITWLGATIAYNANAGALDTFDQILVHVSSLEPLFFISYINAAILTLLNLLFMAGLYLYCRESTPAWSAMNAVFIPIYGALNLVVYLSQVAIVPRLVDLQVTEPAATLLLREVIHLVPGSTVAFINGLAYAVLSAPLIVFSLVLLKEGRLLRTAAWLFLLAAVADVIGLVGILIDSSGLTLGLLIGGVFYLLALIPSTIAFLGDERQLITQGA